jgi:hypothetical protein
VSDEYPRRVRGGAPLPCGCRDAGPVEGVIPCAAHARPGPLFAPDVVRAEPLEEPVPIDGARWALPALQPPRPNLWPRLIAMAEANVQPAPTMDVRQLAAAKARCARLVEMLRGRAAEVGPVTDVSESAAIAGVIDALLGLFALWASAPPKAKPILQGLVDAQLRVVLTLSAISQPVEPPARGEG